MGPGGCTPLQFLQRRVGVPGAAASLRVLLPALPPLPLASLLRARGAAWPALPCCTWWSAAGGLACPSPIKAQVSLQAGGEPLVARARCAPIPSQPATPPLHTRHPQVSLQAGGKPLVVKSPVHTARVRLLLRLFPRARFIYLHRPPLDVLQVCARRPCFCR